MNPLQAFLDSVRPGIDVAAGAAGLSEDELVVKGTSAATARMLRRLGESFFGDTAFSAKQRHAVRVAREREHDLTTLSSIDDLARRAPTQRDAWAMRVKLCAMGGHSAEIEKAGRVMLRRLRTPREVSQGVRITRRKDAPWTLSITADDLLVSDLYAAVPDLEAACGVFRSGAGTTELTTNVIVHLDELDRIVDGDGEEIRLRMTNGATLTGAQLVQRVLSEHGYVTVVHPCEGPVNLYRTSRVGNFKQRAMAGAVNPVCPWPGCNTPADECQLHHLHAWREGGDTNMANLATACKYHNGVNDDDPNAPPRRGRLERVDGSVVWIPPWSH